MTIVDIIKIEADREGKANVVHLIKEGNFYHANDWSAWLMTKFPIGEAATKPMRVTAKRLKDGYVQAFVGFPVTSLGKYIPNDGSVLFVPVSDTQIDVELPADFGNATVDDLRKMVDEWKETLPMNAEKGNRRHGDEVREAMPRVTRLSDIASRVLSFDIAEHTPMEAMQFVRDLQHDIAALF